MVFSFLPLHLGHDGNLTGMPLCCRSGLDLLGGSFWGFSEMSNEKDPFRDAEVREAIDLRWTLHPPLDQITEAFVAPNPHRSPGCNPVRSFKQV